jgi:hypothetical protein
MKNWKTTLLGAAAAGLLALQPLLETGTISPKEIILAFIAAAFGYFAKDKDVTGVK